MRVKIYYNSLPYSYNPYGKLGWRIGNIATLLDYSIEDAWYEFEVPNKYYQPLIEYMRGFGKNRGSTTSKIEIFLDEEDEREVEPRD